MSNSGQSQQQPASLERRLDAKQGATVSFKVDDDLFLSVSDRAGVIPAPYMARAKWVQITDLKMVSDAEIKQLIKRSYKLVSLKLTKNLRTEFGLI
ncbi:MAG: MmcQ/YjbR family DNA-binding protein [Burkholderiales bacterium]|nr:MmcQ/YjbR family DNA-binding protein [Burkholderiales bacterium]